MPKSDLPPATQFSPGQIDVIAVIDLLSEVGGTGGDFSERARKRFFSGYAGGNLDQQREVAKNVRLALHRWEIVGDDDRPTAFGEALISLTKDPPSFHAAVAKHALLNLHGLEVLRAVDHLQKIHEEPTLQNIARELKNYGVYFPPGGTHVSGLKAWFKKAGLLDDRWTRSDERLKELIGVTLEEVDTLERFDPQVRAFIRALAALNPSGPIPWSAVRDHAQAMAHVEFDAKNFSGQVLDPLEAAGYIEVAKTTGGRGAKPSTVRPTEKFRGEFIIPLLEALAKSSGDAPIRADRPLDEVVKELSSPDKHRKGRALEELVVHLCRLLGLTVVGWRIRARETAGSEVDVIAEGTNYVFSRWQIQCKNTSSVSNDTVAREIGVAGTTHANVVMIVTTGRFARPASEFAEKVLQGSAINVILLSGHDLSQVVREPASIGRILRSHARQAMKLKKLDT
jgi:hypothetical protein